jgi:hypothetical protein
MKTLTITVGLIAVLAFAIWKVQRSDDLPAQRSVSPLERCVSERSDQLQRARTLQAEGQHWKAHLLVYECAALMHEAEMTSLSRETEVAAMSARAGDEKESIAWRISSIERVAELDVEAHRGLLTKHAALFHRQRVEQDAAARRIAAEKRRQGVSVGMSQDDVAASSWGRPKQINRTTTARGTEEQWVYDGGYLYFENGRLTAVQH